MSTSRGMRISLGMHAVLLLLVMFGLPAFFKAQRESEPVVLSVEILPPAAKTNIKPAAPAPAPKIEEAKPQPKPAEEQPKPQPPKPTQTSEAALKMPEPEPVTPKEVVSPDAPKEEKKKPEKPKDEPKPQPKAEEKKKPKDEPTLEDILKDVAKAAKPTTPQTPPAKEPAEKPAAPAQDKSTSKNTSTNYDPTAQLSMSENDLIMSQIQRCWNIPAGAKNAKELSVVVAVQLNADGSLISASLAEGQARYATDTFFRAAADSAIRAVKLCTPLQGLAADRYSNWKAFELNFDPSNALW
jgi:outer membrane biosynthesis protein TonB